MATWTAQPGYEGQRLIHHLVCQYRTRRITFAAVTHAHILGESLRHVRRQYRIQLARALTHRLIHIYFFLFTYSTGNWVPPAGTAGEGVSGSEGPTRRTRRSGRRSQLSRPVCSFRPLVSFQVEKRCASTSACSFTVKLVIDRQPQYPRQKDLRRHQQDLKTVYLFLSNIYSSNNYILFA